MAKLQVAEIGKYRRIESLNTAIRMLEETLYPASMTEAKEVMIKALEDRIDDIVYEKILP